jgi:hypothetical protein
MSFATRVRGGKSMRARHETKLESIGRGEGVQSVMPCLSMMSRKYFNGSIEMVRAVGYDVHAKELG